MTVLDSELLHATGGADRVSQRLARLRNALARGADLNARDRGGYTALFRAALHGNDALVAALVAAGADLGPCGALRRSLLHAPLNSAADDREAARVVRQLLVAGLSPDVRDAQGVPPLQLAARYALLEVATHLLAAGAHANAADDVGMTALHEATDRGHHAMCMLLLERGADPTCCNRYGCTPLEFAVEPRTHALLAGAAPAHALAPAPPRRQLA